MEQRPELNLEQGRPGSHSFACHEVAAFASLLLAY
jgi:hypothetical protein